MTARCQLSAWGVVGFAAALFIHSATAQDAAPVNGPDPREIPVPRIETPMGRLPGVSELPVSKDMPDVMVMNDGTPVRTREQWLKRREELKRILEYYAVGQMPPAPGNVKGKEMQSSTAREGTINYRQVRLTFGPEEKLSLNIGIWTPAEGGPFPAVILQSGTPPGAPDLPRQPQGPNQGRGENVLLLVGSELPPGSEPRPACPRRSRPPATAESIAERYANVLDRGYALVMFNPNDCAEDTTLRNMDGSWAHALLPGLSRL